MTTDLTTFAETEFRMRYKEPFLTAGLNKKLAVAVPTGIYRGFRLEVDAAAGDRTVDIQGDSDHVAIYLTEADGYALTIRRTSGDFLIDLSAYESETVVLALYATYAIGFTTSVVLRAYTEAEYAGASEKDELLVLGSVDVPAAGNDIEASMLHPTGRSMAWRSEATEAVFWAQQVKNPSFEWSDDSTPTYLRASAYWEAEVTGGSATATWAPSATSPNSGSYCMALDLTVIGTVNSEVRQKVYTRVHEGQRLLVRFYKQAVQAAASGTLIVYASYINEDGVEPLMATPANYSVTVDLSSPDTGYVEVEATLEVPVGYDLSHLQEIRVAAQNLEFTSTGTAVRIDDIQAWLETDVLDRYLADESKGSEQVSELTVVDPSSDFSDFGAQALIQFLTDTLRIARRDGTSGSAVAPVSLELLGQIYNLGANLVNSNSQQETPRVYAPLGDGATYRKTLIWESPATGGAAPLRLYASPGTSSGGGFIFTVNALYNTTTNQWSRDVAGDSVGLWLTKSYGLQYTVREAADASPWVDWPWSFGATFRAATKENFIDGAPTTLGNAMIYDTADALEARLIMPSDGRRTLIFEMPNTGGEPGTRVYRIESGTFYFSMEITNNAYWDGSVWNYDQVPHVATRVTFGPGTDLGEYFLSGQGTEYYNGSDGWAESAWSEPAMVLGGNPANTVDVQCNTLYAKNIIKAWASVETGNSPSPPTIRDGFNIVGDSYVSERAYFDFNTAMDDDNFAIVCTYTSPNLSNITVVAQGMGKATSGFALEARDPDVADPGNLIDLRTTSLDFDVIVVGKQTFTPPP